MAVCSMLAITLHGKTVKTITVADGIPFTDHIAMATDATDKDLMVKFVFDESSNTLTISVLSYRMLFVFWESTPYKGVIRRRWIHTDRLPYVVTAEEGQRFRLSKPLRNALPKPYKKHIFKKWIGYDGLQPQEKELKMLNDYIEQTFDIQNKRSNVTVTLRDIMLMEATKQKKLNTCYTIDFGKDLNTEYQITIQRNPCFGLNQEKEAAQKAKEAVKKSFNSLKQKYGDGIVSSAEAKKTFEELKSMLTAQFQHNNDSSACPVIQDYIDQYNLLADSLAAMTVNIEMVKAQEKILGSKGNEANEKIVLSNARQIDSKVAHWLNSRDASERADIISECQSIIKDTKLIINTLSQTESNEAIRLFRHAEQYFNKTCK